MKHLLPVFLMLVLFIGGCNLHRNGTEKAESLEHMTLTSADTIAVMHANVPPIIDGKANDKTWEKAPWLPINKVWIPYGATIDSTVFYGRYKLAWSEETNLLYVLAEITDNVFVGGHVYNPDPALGNGYADYDILEIFIDEDDSGGLHVFDTKPGEPLQWGHNAENAFAYHITILPPADEQTVTEKRALDIAGHSWSDYFIADFQNHIPEFAVYRKGNKYTWELSLQVYDDSYDHANPEPSKVALSDEKQIGFSMAYCNNDDMDEQPKKRDHFFGSVKVPEENYNDHWMDATFFGTMVLTK